jgi:hypothetical protein
VNIQLNRIWDELHVDKNTALDFIAVFARFEYALKRCGFLKAAHAAKPNWESFERKLREECTREGLTSVFVCASYLITKPTKQQVVNRDRLEWEEEPPQEGNPSLSWLLRVVRTTRNNLFHGGKFPEGPEKEPLRDTRLISESTDVLLKCLDLDSDAARRVRDVFWRFDAAG